MYQDRSNSNNNSRTQNNNAYDSIFNRTASRFNEFSAYLPNESAKNGSQNTKSGRLKQRIPIIMHNQDESMAEIMIAMNQTTRAKYQNTYGQASDRYASNKYNLKYQNNGPTQIYVKPKEQPEICQICNQKHKLDRVFACNHKCCSGCLLAQVNSNLKSFEMTRCLHGCGAVVRDEQSILASLSVADQKKYKRIRQFRQAEGEGFKLCPICEDEVGILIVKDGLKRNSVSCARCDKIFCRKCLLIEHEGLCDNQMSLWLQEGLNMAVCPNQQCAMTIQLGAGCNHMTCKCKTQFCYKCEELWSSSHICPSNNRKQRRIEQFKKRKQMSPQQYQEMVKKQERDKILKQEQKRREEERKRLEELQKKRKAEQEKERKRRQEEVRRQQEEIRRQQEEFRKQQEEARRRQEEARRKQEEQERKDRAKIKYAAKRKKDNALNTERNRKQMLPIKYFNWLYAQMSAGSMVTKLVLFPSLVVGQILIIMTLIACIAFNSVLSWLIILPIRQIAVRQLLDYQIDTLSLQSALYLFPVSLTTIILYLIYLLFVPMFLTEFTSQLHLFDIRSIMIGQLPIILQNNMKLQNRTNHDGQLHEYCEQDIRQHCLCCMRYQNCKVGSSMLMYFSPVCFRL